jgi:hypothetical protein
MRCHEVPYDCDEYGRCDDIQAYEVRARRPLFVGSWLLFPDQGHVNSRVRIERLCQTMRVTIIDGPNRRKFVVPSTPQTIVRVWDTTYPSELLKAAIGRTNVVASDQHPRTRVESQDAVETGGVRRDSSGARRSPMYPMCL